MSRPVRSFILLLAASIIADSGILFAGPPRSMNGAEIQLALRKLMTLGSVLYVAAHPDDENTAFLTYAAKGRNYRVAYLSATRGEGGQNLIGTEQGDLMGVIRTQELLAARRIDGAEQFFTRAIDFGYSKTSDETLQKWGRDRILGDMVWIIRTYQPDIIVTRFTPTLGGHGNHTASAILGQLAYEAAADPKAFPEQLTQVAPWKAKRLVWNVFRSPTAERTTPSDSVIEIDIGGYSPLLGKSFTEIAGESRSMHKSQGFGAGQNRGELINGFRHIAGELAGKDLMDGINTAWSRVSGSDSVAILLGLANDRFKIGAADEILPYLVRAYVLLNRLPNSVWVAAKKEELLEVIRACGGMWCDVLSIVPDIAPGGEARITTAVIQRSRYPFSLHRIKIPWGVDSTMNLVLKENQVARISGTLRVPRSYIPAPQYWLRHSAQNGSYRIDDSSMLGMAEDPSPCQAEVEFSTPDGNFQLAIPVRYRSVDPIEGELYRPLQILPPATVRISDRIIVAAGAKAKTLDVTTTAQRGGVSGKIVVNPPPGWSVSIRNQEFHLDSTNAEHKSVIEFTAASGARHGECIVQVLVDGRAIDADVRRVEYPHIVPQIVLKENRVRLLALDLRHAGQNIGYVMGAGDEVPVILRQIGYSVTLLTDEELAAGNLSTYDAIVAGIRAYNTRPRLRAAQRRMMEYVQQGGNYIVQYVTPQRGESEDLGPFPFTVSRDRVTVEEAPIEFIMPDHPVLRFPNRITQEDFSGWIQERGLYFADRWDPRYDSVLTSADPGERPLRGGMLYGRYGKGTYIFTGYAFFRQLPAGVPGAVRLFTNLVSQSALRSNRSQERSRKP